MTESLTLACTLCGTRYPLDTREWQCPCGGLFDLKPWPAFDAQRIDRAQQGLWRYRALLPLDPTWEPVTLGEGGTPLVPIDWAGRTAQLKIESQEPTGSFKDRGAAVLVTALRGLGIARLVDDSSGNAGASLAAYAARAGLACDVCVPSQVVAPKLAQMAAHGAEVIQIKGRREYSALAAWAAAAHGAYYASHLYHPHFLAGVETMAYELWEQLGRRAPGVLIAPIGNGTLLLALYRGFRRLMEAHLVEDNPRLVGVQAQACAPLYEAFAQDRTDVEAVRPEPTMATGVAIANPARGSQILAAVRASGGSIVAVTEEEIRTAQDALARRGFFVEPTAAVALAGMNRLAPDSLGNGTIVVPLTGHGLKTA